METKSIGKFIATLRKANGYTQTELAKLLCVSNKTISNWENEVSYPDLSLIPVIADVFNITSDELLRGAKNNNSTQNEKKVNEQYLEIKSNKVKENIKKNMMNKYSDFVYISLGILALSYILIFLGYDCIHFNTEKALGIVLSILGISAYITGLIFSIINSNRFINKLDLEEDNSSLYYFHLRKNLLLKCFYGFIILSPIFIHLYYEKLLNDDKYHTSEEVRNKLKIKLWYIFTGIGIVIVVSVIILNLISIIKSYL